MLRFPSYLETAMSDAKSGPDWSKDWQAMQSQYWNAWSDLTRKQGGAQPEAATPWHEGREQWSRMFAGPGKQSEATERLMSSAGGCLAWGRAGRAGAAGGSAAGGGAA